MGSAIIFWILATIAVVTAAMTVLNRNPVRGALMLVAHMLTLAVMYLTLSAQFVAAVQVIVYAGAIMVLVLFTIMLLNLGVTGGGIRSRGAGFVLAVIGALTLTLAMVGGSVWRHGLAPMKATADSLERGGTAQAIGYALYDPELPWLFPFEVTSLLLLSAIVGAVVLTRRRSE